MANEMNHELTRLKPKADPFAGSPAPAVTVTLSDDLVRTVQRIAQSQEAIARAAASFDSGIQALRGIGLAENGAIALLAGKTGIAQTKVRELLQQFRSGGLDVHALLAIYLTSRLKGITRQQVRSVLRELDALVKRVAGEGGTS